MYIKTKEINKNIQQEYKNENDNTFSISGMHGIIADNSNAFITNNIFDFGTSFILANNSKAISIDNQYLIKRINLHSKDAPITATVQIEQKQYNIPFTLNEISFSKQLERLKNNLLVFQEKQFTYIITNTVQNVQIPISYQGELIDKSDQGFNIQYTLNIKRNYSIYNIIIVEYMQIDQYIYNIKWYFY